MSTEPQTDTRGLLRSILILQLKLLIEAARDLAMSEVTLAAGFAPIWHWPRAAILPRYFEQISRFGQRSDEWIDLVGLQDDQINPAQPGSVDALLASVEQVVSDPQSGARKARVLKRWAERQLSRARRSVEQAPPAS